MKDQNITSSSIKSLFDTAAGYFLVTDTTSQVVYTNQAIEDRTGFSSSEVMGKKPGQLWGGRMPRTFYDRLWNTIQTKQQIFVEEVTNQKKNHEVYHEEMFVVPLMQEDQIKYFIAFKPNFKNNFEKEDSKKELQNFLSSKKEENSILLSKILTYINRDICHEEILPQDLSALEVVENYLVQPTIAQYQNRSVDKNLVLSAQQDSHLFDTIYSKYHKTIFLYFLKHLGSHMVSEDLAQETFLRAFSHLSLFVPSNATYQTYLLRIAHNILVNHYRKVTPALWDESMLMTVPAPSQMDALSAKLSVDAAFTHLSSEDQHILNLMYYQGLSIREIAEKLEKTENAVKLRVSRARKYLKNVLEK